MDSQWLSIPRLGAGEIDTAAARLPALETLLAAGLAPPSSTQRRASRGSMPGSPPARQSPTAYALAALFDAEALRQAAIVTGALSTDAARGTDTPFNERIHRLRGHPGQLDTARQPRADRGAAGIRLTVPLGRSTLGRGRRAGRVYNRPMRRVMLMLLILLLPLNGWAVVASLGCLHEASSGEAMHSGHAGQVVHALHADHASHSHHNAAHGDPVMHADPAAQSEAPASAAGEVDCAHADCGGCCHASGSVAVGFARLPVVGLAPGGTLATVADVSPDSPALDGPFRPPRTASA